MCSFSKIALTYSEKKKCSGDQEKLQITRKIAQCLASYFGDPGKISMVLSIVFFRLAQARNLVEEIMEKIKGPGNLISSIPLIYSNSESSDQFLKQNAFLTCSWRT